MASANHFRINLLHVTYQTIDTEVIVINLDDGSYYSLRQSGAEIWALLDRRVDKENIIASLCQRYPLDTDQITDAVEQFLTTLQDEGLILADLAPEPREQTSPEPARAVAAQPSVARFEPPEFEKYTDMKDLLLLDPIHEVTEEGWPYPKQEPSK